MDYSQFITDQIEAVSKAVGDASAICALSGGVDSATVAVLAENAIGHRLHVVFIDSGLMREGEADQIVTIFAKLKINVRVVDARQEFLLALKGLTDPEAKRKAITQAFYGVVFKRLIEETGATVLLHGTILTDVEETVRGIKGQHNILEQIGIDPLATFGYRILEPLVTLRKDDVRKVAHMLGLPKEISERIPFPGPGLAARIIGEVTEERLAIVRKATVLVEEDLAGTEAFQYFAYLFNDQATGIRDGKRQFGDIIGIRCVQSVDARLADATQIPWDVLLHLGQRITDEIPCVCRVVYEISGKPPATIEVV